MTHRFTRCLLLLVSLGFWSLAARLPAAVVTHDFNSLNLVTPPSSGADGPDGNSAIGIWFNMVSGEAFVAPTAAGIPGKTDLADGRFQLRQNTAFTPAAAQMLIQGNLTFNGLRGTTTAIDGQVTGQISRFGVGQVVNATGWTNARFLDLAGTFGVWNARGRGFVPLRFRIGTTGLRYGYADITILPDNRIRLNGVAYENVALAAITTSFIGAVPPNAATGLAVTGITGTTVGLSWVDNSSNEVGFKIDRRLPSEPFFTTVATTGPEATTFTDQGLAPSTTYEYRIVATTGADAEPTATVFATTATIIAPPAAVTGLTAAPSTATSIRLTWNDNATDEIGVKLERAVGLDAFLPLTTTGPSANTYLDLNLLPGQTYRYRATATNGLDAAPSNIAASAPFTLAETIGASAATLAYPTITGAGVTLGLWDFGTARADHAEFGGRVVNANASAAVDNHTTHAAGIAIAAGASPGSRGVAPAANLSLYDSTDDETEMRSVGMQWPGQPGRIQAASASYGPIRGWNPTLSGTSWVFNTFRVEGAPQAFDPAFGAYGSFSRDADLTARVTPYLLVARSSGNDRDDVPSAGQFVYLSLEDFSSNTVTLFNPTLQPLIDGGLHGGHTSLADAAAAKNVITVGAVNGVSRHPLNSLFLAAPTATSFSGWGPTNDGRIKPDLVALGVNVRSAASSAADAYSVLSGTSQAGPQASAAAGLLTQAWSASGPGRFLRASTLKALLLHTADDLETPGPDTKTGWGLLNVKAALDQLYAHIAAPAAGYLTEGRLAAGQTTHQSRVRVPASGDLRVTLAWTDPEASLPALPGSAASLLINDLDLVVTGPSGTVYRPYVLPYALDPTASRGATVVTGINRVDTVEQVRVGGLPAGDYTIQVSTASSLSGGPQYFSLVSSGGPAPEPTILGPVPTLVRITSEPGVAEILGSGFQLGARVRLNAVIGAQTALFDAIGVEVTPQHIRFRYDSAQVFNASWKVEVLNPDGRSAFARWPVGPGTAGGFEAWQDALYTDAQLGSAIFAAPAADPDNDGFPQLIAYAFGSSTGSVPAASRPEAQIASIGGGNRALRLTFVRRVGASDVAVVAENAPAPGGPWESLPASQYSSPVSLGGGLEQLTATDTVALGHSAGTLRFLRLRIERL